MGSSRERRRLILKRESLRRLSARESGRIRGGDDSYWGCDTWGCFDTEGCNHSVCCGEAAPSRLCPPR